MYYRNMWEHVKRNRPEVQRNNECSVLLEKEWQVIYLASPDAQSIEPVALPFYHSAIAVWGIWWIWGGQLKNANEPFRSERLDWIKFAKKTDLNVLNL
ncbi:MAG TPA: hypothetical protein VFK37_05635 [Bacillales bacterium]|nr:hypothetical protein [Bacillales bacterium]